MFFFSDWITSFQGTQFPFKFATWTQFLLSNMNLATFWVYRFFIWKEAWIIGPSQEHSTEGCQHEGMLRDRFDEDSKNGNEDLKYTSQITKQVKKVINSSDRSNRVLVNPIGLWPQKIRPRSQIWFDRRCLLNLEKWIMERWPFKSDPLIKRFDVVLQQMVVIMIVLCTIKKMSTEIFQAKFYRITDLLFETGAFFYGKNWNLQVVDELVDFCWFSAWNTLCVRILGTLEEFEAYVLSRLILLGIEAPFELGFSQTLKAQRDSTCSCKSLKFWLYLSIIFEIIW